MAVTWSDEQIASSLTGLVVGRQYREVKKLMFKMRSDMQAELEAQTVAAKAAFNNSKVESIKQQADVLFQQRRSCAASHQSTGGAMNVDVTGIKNAPKTAPQLAQLCDAYKLLFGDVVVVFTGTLVKNDVKVLDNQSGVVSGWGGYTVLQFDIGNVEFCTPEPGYKLFFIPKDRVGDRFTGECTCRLVAICAGDPYIIGGLSCPVHNVDLT